MDESVLKREQVLHKPGGPISAPLAAPNLWKGREIEPLPAGAAKNAARPKRPGIALLVIDMDMHKSSCEYPGIVSAQGDYAFDTNPLISVIEKAVKLGMPIVFFEYNNEYFTFEHLLRAAKGKCNVKKKYEVSAFSSPSLKPFLEGRDEENWKWSGEFAPVGTLLITGYSLGCCVKESAADARKLGYEVVLARETTFIDDHKWKEADGLFAKEKEAGSLVLGTAQELTGLMEKKVALLKERLAA